MKNSRGAVLAETALFVSAALLFMLGTIQIGVIGFFQLTADGASYYDARANVLTVSSYTPEYQTHKAFDQIPAVNIVPTTLPAPVPTIPVDYGYNDPNATVAANSATTRHGGASMLTPAQEQVTVTTPILARILGNAIGATAVDVESMYQECGTHFDIANVGCSLANPPSNSQTNYFTQGENTPPYLVGRNLLQQCTDNQPFGTYTGGNTNITATSVEFAPLNDSRTGNAGGWQTPCIDTQGNNNVQYIAMGTAEYLDTANWSDTGTGGSSSNGSGISGSCDTSYGTAQNVFEAVAWHQRTYSALAQYFVNNPEHYTAELYSQLYDPGNLNNTTNSFLKYYAAGIGPAYNINSYQFYNTQGTDSGAIAIPEVIQTFESWEGFDDSNDGPNGANGDYYNNLVHTIYAWDQTVGAGQAVGQATYTHPTTPDLGCS